MFVCFLYFYSNALTPFSKIPPHDVIISEHITLYYYFFVFFIKHSFALMMTSNWYEDLSVVIILFYFSLLKWFSIECFCIQNFEVETRWHKNKSNKPWTNNQNYTNIYFSFISFFHTHTHIYIYMCVCVCVCVCVINWYVDVETSSL